MLPLVPAPAHLEEHDGPGFPLAGPLRLVTPDAGTTDADPVAAPLADLADSLAAAGAALGASAGAPEIIVELDPDDPQWVLARDVPPASLTHDAAALEAYRLTVGADRVHLLAPAPVGLARGLTTLVHLVRGSADAIPAVAISDAPRYAWRGLSIDIARHFFPLSVLKEVVDLAAGYKLNALHVHLTDDQGWRLELTRRPLLTERSGGTEVGGGEGGYLSQADWAELVAHAASRAVTVVPEIDLPGHTHAALHAYGQLTPTGEAPPPYTGTDVGFSQITLNEPATKPFLDDVLGELADLTPGPYLHGGGDEAHVMTRQDYLDVVAELGRVVAGTGKVLVVWQEGGAADLPPGSLVQLWASGTDLTPVLDAAERGHDVIMSPGNHIYLDMKYTPEFPLGLDWAGHVDLERSWSWDPDTYADGLDPARIRGIEAAVWTETLATRDDLFTMLLPRLAAVAEVAWSPQSVRDASGFAGLVPRLAVQAPTWRAHDWAFHPVPEVPWL
ncbi:beta-N-acetylhexosaminidase [Georgenia halophila]|uniref:beta-N-acetylhexosaminidase n=1 Tax=Georgenia halophila TaxID=620889 RepID=A0ABP8LS75_9MICO